MNPYIFNFSNGVLFVILGLWSYSLDWNYSGYFIVLGLALMGLTYFVKNSNKLLGSTAMIATMVATIVLGVLFFSIKDNAALFTIPIAMMTTSAFVTSLAFVQCAVNHSQEVPCSAQSGDSTCCDQSQRKNESLGGTGCC